MSEKIFNIKPWAPETKNIAERIIDNVHKTAPELTVLFMGAAALELSGKNDIDLDILCDEKDISFYTVKLTPVLGKPKEVTDQLAAWNYDIDGFEVDLILSDPKKSHVPIQKEIFEILKNDSTLKEEYERLKKKCDGMTYVQYENMKISFFNKILELNTKKE